MPDWGSAAAWTTHAITLNGLSAGSSSLGSTVIDNSVTKRLFLEVELVLGSFTPGGAPSVEVHAMALLSGGGYQDMGTNTLFGVVPLTAGAGVKQGGLFIPNTRMIGPGSYLLGVVNVAGASFAASGNSLKSRLIPVG